MIKVGMVSLGCSKNQVDAERMMAILQQAGMKLENDSSQCDAIIINTCGFIEAAKAESIETILEFAQLKEEGNLKVVAVTGCLAERYQQEMQESIPEIDVLLGIGSNQNIVEAIKTALSGEKVAQFGEKSALSIEGPRVLANDSHFAYLKVAEGCDNRCTYCAIPSIRGNFRSRTIESLVEEAKELAKLGVTELNVVAQDTTRYGEDIYGKLMLPELLRRLCEIPEIHWVRMLYCYPERITDDLLDVMATEEKVVKYIDLPLQHASDDVLKRMNRHVKSAEIRALLEKIRAKVPGVIIRTTFIAGFPGETEEDFEKLCTLVSDMKFERLGCFAYSQEEGTPAAKLPDQLDEDVKARRAEVVMEVQMGIVEEFNESMIGKTLEILTEGYDEEMNMAVGRSYMDAPDVDSRVYFNGDGSYKGQYITVEIIDIHGYDLIGKVV